MEQGYHRFKLLTLTKQVRDALRLEIQKKSPGEKMDSNARLAQRFHVSLPTIRTAVTELVGEGWLERGEGRAIHVKDRSDRQAPHIALLSGANFLSPRVSRFGGFVFTQLRRHFQEAGYNTRLYIGNGFGKEDGMNTAAELLAEAKAGRVCGVVTLYAPQPTTWIEQIKARAIPLVGDYAVYSHTVDFPYRAWTAAAIQQLVAQGRRRVAMLCWHGHALQELFREELSRCGLEYHAEWMGEGIHPNERGAGWSEFREVWSSRRERPDGLIVADDQLTPDVCAALRELGVRVPEQLLVVTHANTECPLNVSLPMIKVEYDAITHARLMGEMMVKLLRGERVDQPHCAGSDRFKIYDAPAYADGAESLSESETNVPAEEAPVVK